MEKPSSTWCLVRYLKATRQIGLKFKPDPSKGFQCYCDADFAGNWNKAFAATAPSTAKSNSGWIVVYANCPIIWASKLQSQVALTTTEAEYIDITLPCPWHYVTSSLSWSLSRRCRTANLTSSTRNLMCTARSLKTTLVHLNLQGCRDSDHAPSTSTCAIITSVNTSEKA